jgi:hypothetical protein
MVLKMARDLEKGIEPAAASHGEWYNVRSCATLLPRDTDWQQGAAWLLAGGQIKSAAE